MTFDRYATYYDTLYQDKDYEAECDFLEQIFACYAQSPIRTILDLGCGTGGHALSLARRGYEVIGIDRSEKMLATAWDKAGTMLERSGVPTFQRGDIRNLALGRTFDAVTAMFAVISYQTTNEDLLAAFRKARRHLKPGGLFVFDAWFGPTVLTQRPRERIKIIEIAEQRIIRFATPRLDIMTHTVEVNYTLMRLRDGHVLEEVDECHTMRFFFPQEVMNFLEMSRMRLLHMSPFMAFEQHLNTEHWNFCVVAGAT